MYTIHSEVVRSSFRRQFLGTVRRAIADCIARARHWQFAGALVLLASLCPVAASGQAAGNGEPWIDGSVNNFSSACQLTMDAQSCLNDVISQLCGLGQAQACGVSVVSCSAVAPGQDHCTTSDPSFGDGDVVSGSPEFYVSTHPLAPGNCGGCDPTDNSKVGDPINPANGNVSHRETDIPSQGPSLQSAFERFYNSLDSNSTDLGIGWRHSFSRQIVPIVMSTPYQAYSSSDPQNSSIYGDPASACTSGWNDVSPTNGQWANTTATYANGVCSISKSGTVVASIPVFNAFPVPRGIGGGPAIGYSAVRDDGRAINFTINGTNNVPPTGSTLRLTSQGGNGFTLIDDDDNTEVYNGHGQLTSVTSRSGISETLSYDSSSRLSTIVDNFGHKIVLTYNASNQLTGVTDPSSNLIQYGYDSSGMLASVTNLDGTTRSYAYSGYTGTLLTDVYDENGTDYSTWQYDSEGRGIVSEEIGGGADTTTATYNSDGSVTVTDALGAVRTFTYQLIGNESRVTSISGSQCPTCGEGASTTYDANGFVASRTDYNGDLSCYAHDAVRGLELVRAEGFAPGSTCPSNLTSYTPAPGTNQRKISTTWHATYRLPTTVVEPSRTTSFAYDSVGNVLTKTITDTTVTPNVSRTWTYTYDSYGRMLTAKGPRTDVNSTTTHAYYTCTTGSQCGQLETVTDSVGNVTTYNSYNAHGQPLTITDPNGVVTTLTYNTRMRLTSRKVGSETTAFSYYPTGLLKQVTLPDSSYVTYTYDSAHRLTQISDGAGNAIQYTLDTMGNRTAEGTFDPSNNLHRTHTRAFNTLNRLYQDINTAGTSDVTTTYVYDSNGNQTGIEAPLARNTTNAYDSLNRLSQITDPNNGNTNFTYDAEDDLISVKDPRNFTTSYSYNGFGGLTSQVSPDTGTTHDTYDSGGNLSTSTDARGAISTYTYDAANRVTSISYKLGGTTDQTLAFGYDSGTNGKGRLTSASDANHSLAWTYDFMGRVVGKGLTVGTVTLSVGYAYTNGDRTALVTPSGQSVAYGYNSNHQVTSITVNGTTVLTGVTYEPFGGVNGWSWGDSTTTSRTFNGDGLISQIVTAGVTLGYSFDNANRITGISDSSNGALTWTYGYDLLDRLTSATTSAITDGWTYDSNGNQLTQTGTTPITFSVSSSHNQLTATTGSLVRSYSYDAAGHTTGYGTNGFTYNNRGRIAATAASSTDYLYNALGQMIEKSGTLGTTLFIQDEAGHLIGEYNGSGGLIEETIWLGDMPVATLQPNGSGGVNIFYVHTDHLNSPRKIAQPTTGTLTWRWDSDPFGTAAPNQNPAGLGTFAYNLRFPGQYYDAETGLLQNWNRDYDPIVARYVESDPIGLNGGINTYSYVSGNPLLFTDMLGLICRKGERFLRDMTYRDLSRRRELGRLYIPFVGQVQAELDVSPTIGPRGISLELGPNLTWATGNWVWEQDEIREGYIISRFYSRKYYCKSDDSCNGNQKEWVEIRNDDVLPGDQDVFAATYTQWIDLGFVPNGYTLSTP